MSITITMPQQMDTVFRDATVAAARQVTAQLAEKYGFDVDEANRFLNLDDIKIQRKRGPSPKQSEEKPAKVKNPKKTKQAKAERTDAPAKPKRGTTGYLVFGKSIRAEVSEELSANLEEGTKLKQMDVTPVIASHWKALTDEEKLVWNQQAKALNDAAKAEHESACSTESEE